MTNKLEERPGQENEKTLEEKLRDAEAKMRAVFAVVNDAFVMIDGKGTITFWNKAAENMFGYSEKEALGKDCHLLLAPGRFHEAYKKAFPRFQATGEGDVIGKTRELAALRKGGEEFSIELSLSAVNIKGEWNAVGVIRDVTERRRMEEELKKQMRVLERFQKVTMGREERILELKRELKRLKEKTGQ